MPASKGAGKTNSKCSSTRTGAGRKPIGDVVASAFINIRSTPNDKSKFAAVGGVNWFRRALARAKVPTKD